MYSSDVIEAAQAQVLREQDAALQQTMASHRSVDVYEQAMVTQIS